FATVGAVVGEWVGAESGLGYLLLSANANLDTTLLFAVLVALMVIGLVLYYAVEIAERLMIPWHISVRSDAPATN
ncbi:ABC transporter permease subunit, partial [Rhizobiaceae sp. 2RAB30]